MEQISRNPHKASLTKLIHFQVYEANSLKNNHLMKVRKEFLNLMVVQYLFLEFIKVNLIGTTLQDMIALKEILKTLCYLPSLMHMSMTKLPQRQEWRTNQTDPNVSFLKVLLDVVKQPVQRSLLNKSIFL